MLISKDKIMLQLRWIVLLAFCLAIFLPVANRRPLSWPEMPASSTLT
jgi:hypothetical protein